MNTVEDHPWQSARDKFDSVVLPRLRQAGKQIGEAAAAGNAKAAEIMSLYALLYRSFDPLTLIRLERALDAYALSPAP